MASFIATNARKCVKRGRIDMNWQLKEMIRLVQNQEKLVQELKVVFNGTPNIEDLVRLVEESGRLDGLLKALEFATKAASQHLITGWTSHISRAVKSESQDGRRMFAINIERSVGK